MNEWYEFAGLYALVGFFVASVAVKLKYSNYYKPDYDIVALDFIAYLVVCPFFISINALVYLWGFYVKFLLGESE